MEISMTQDDRKRIRQNLIDEIEADIVGPRDDTEIIRQNPEREYMVGVLFPNGSELDSEDPKGDENVEDQESDKIVMSKYNPFKPSSFGLTCLVDSGAKPVTVTVSYATYDTVTDKDSSGKYKRIPESHRFIVDIGEGEGSEHANGRHDLVIRYRIVQGDGHTMLSVHLVNNARTNGRSKLAGLIFQPRITLESGEGEAAFLEDSVHGRRSHGRNDLSVLFRDRMSFGKGHLCAVTWDDADVDKASRRVRRVYTTFIPMERVDPISPDTIGGMGCLDMVGMAQCTDRQELKGMLDELVSKYEAWVDGVSDTGGIEEEYREGVVRNIGRCRTAIERMRKGIDMLTSNDDAFEAFRFANEAIAWQQTMGRWAKSNATAGEVMGSEPQELERDKCRWWPFQMAFILLNVEPIANPRSKERGTVDLLWFPTGGGKTEAYLGLAAFTIAHRRLRGRERGNMTSKGLGTTVLMRYTLRLLTVQQFQRAATLMCACEKIRVGNTAKWGGVPFQVGLWVGGSVTPNKRTEGKNSAKAIKGRTRGELMSIKDHNPYILINCPWCGKKLNAANGEVSGKPLQWRLFCGRNKCMFSKHQDVNEDMSLPVVVVDEDVYSRCPSMIIATVDKFAQISWKEECRSIFGIVKEHCDRCGFHSLKDSQHTHARNIPVEMQPPELIIQDELHLISGALGSITGIYETAIDYLCTTKEGTRPKIIASTATTRNAGEQIQKLFNRDKTSIFPQQVSEFGETFFSKVEGGSNSKIYLGVFGSTTSELNILTRVSAVILGRIRAMAKSGEYDERDLDPYVSLVSYFNTLRDLGRASMGFRDSVPGLMTRIQKRSGPSPSEGAGKEGQKGRRWQDDSLEIEELTSRKSSGEIPDTLRKLDITLGANHTDVLLATNMLSVGVDIQRLSSMVVNGQPKNHSEYIQATGRIGRRYPGLIITVYSPTKPRDLSHYESFRAYHQRFFENVEVSSVTPFTARTRDIALFGVFVGMLRMKYDQLSADADASRFDQGDADQRNAVERIRNVLMDRVDNVDPAERSGMGDEISRFAGMWTAYGKEYGRSLRYANRYSEKTPKSRIEQHLYLLKSHQSADNEFIWTPTSFRSAEQEQRMFYWTGEN